MTLLEYAFRTDPRQPSGRPPVNPLQVVMDGGSYLTLTFTRNRFATDVAISYEGFADCLTWLPVFPATIATTFVDFETELWTVHILAPEPRFFIRARVQN